MTKNTETLTIIGGKPLQGEIAVPGAKNAITKLLVASVLSTKKCIFENVPNIQEVELTLDFCQEIGMQVAWDQENRILEVQTKELRSTYIPQRFSGANRIPILMIGALLGRTQEDIIVPTAGGCKIGKRPVDFHIQALEQLGATIEYRGMKKEGAYFAHAHHGLVGALIELPYPSVGATENAILGACRAQGKTIIKNAAIEPEVMDLILFLQKLGVSIQVDVNRVIEIIGTTQFHEVQHRVIPDRTVAASFGMLALATQGEVLVQGARQEHMLSFLNHVRKLGGEFTITEKGITFFATKTLKGGLHVETDVYPGFVTDWQQPFAVLLTQAQGLSVLHETVYENRFGYIETLKEMGAETNLFSECLGGKNCRFASKNYRHSLVVKGKIPLQPKNISIPDLRAGFAYVLAALIASGKSIISNLHYLDRGYEDLTANLAAIGANVTRQSSYEKRTDLEIKQVSIS